jgi:chemotaxis protein methyltransferase CheR
LLEFELKEREFEKIASIVYDHCRLNLRGGKKPLVEARLAKRLRALGMGTYKDYLALVEADEEELGMMITSLTTNHTKFFREPEHFEFLQKSFFPEVLEIGIRTLRIWSAGCSSGEEPYSIAIEMRESLPDIGRMDALVLATDISRKALRQASEGVYTVESVKNVPAALRNKYFSKSSAGGELLEVKPVIKNLVRCRHLNLMDPWPMKKGFNIVFCRNVMIYFDKVTQQGLVGRFQRVIRPGGVLIVGHCESLAGMGQGFRCVSPTIYQKI